ncbi:NAD(P)H-binding protein [Pyxidicoccus sp. MSG2]|uniref:NAD(P)H-binding protein n=1 Tax=Pyxidicoccus sp. MSG2 TaxID=2996790 RepID=UPI00226EF0F8|nr:NAD(P)H-binding protein [Pyxidicoccus sp. MSG2]MCY1014252.1 NAD(P)H-binding protein [Pyxidicoccus sp. MSG2]
MDDKLPSSPAEQRDDGPPCSRVLVTGALGNVGREVLRALAARGIAARAAVRSVERARAVLGPEADVVALDFLDARTFQPALAGCDALFLLRPPALSDVKPTLNRLVDVAVAGGIRHIVFLSVVGADMNKLLPHHAVERHLEQQSRTGWTLLRPGFFAQNLGHAYRRDIVEDGRIYVPAGKSSVAFVDVRDVAEVAARVFAAPRAHAGKAHTLTGPEHFTFLEVAETLTEALGIHVRYQSASMPGYLLHLARRGLPASQVLVQTVLHAGLRSGQAARVDPTLTRLLGRPGRTMRDYVHDHVSLWKTAPAAGRNPAPGSHAKEAR